MSLLIFLSVGYSASGSSTVAIDNKIEQAMDLVKSHLMFAVREEVEVLKERIDVLMERIAYLESENQILRAAATQVPSLPPTIHTKSVLFLTIEILYCWFLGDVGANLPTGGDIRQHRQHGDQLQQRRIGGSRRQQHDSVDHHHHHIDYDFFHTFSSGERNVTAVCAVAAAPRVSFSWFIFFCGSIIIIISLRLPLYHAAASFCLIFFLSYLLVKKSKQIICVSLHHWYRVLGLSLIDFV